jgi:hypothetical protein
MKVIKDLIKFGKYMLLVKICENIISAVILHGLDTWSDTLREEHR